MLGFAHRDGTLNRTRPAVVLGLALTAVTAGGIWTATHRSPDSGYDLNDIPLGQALISVGAVLILLRLSPRLTFLDRAPLLGGPITVINARTITIYLWHNIAIDLAVPIDDWFGWESLYAQLGVTLLLTAVAVLAFGWIEDLAARRRIQLIPTGRAATKPHPPSEPSIPTAITSQETDQSINHRCGVRCLVNRSPIAPAGGNGDRRVAGCNRPRR
jgi:peptidoglycan/LPS O-acetylase OafA/YrhL